MKKVIHNTKNSTEPAVCGIVVQNNKEHGWIASNDPEACESFIQSFPDQYKKCRECWGEEIIRELDDEFI